MAPGGDLSRDQSGDGYADGVLQETIEGGRWTYTFWEGTSMAAPQQQAYLAERGAAAALSIRNETQQRYFDRENRSAAWINLIRRFGGAPHLAEAYVDLTQASGLTTPDQ